MIDSAVIVGKYALALTRVVLTVASRTVRAPSRGSRRRKRLRCRPSMWHQREISEPRLLQGEGGGQEGERGRVREGRKRGGESGVE